MPSAFLKKRVKYEEEKKPTAAAISFIFIVPPAISRFASCSRHYAMECEGLTPVCALKRSERYLGL